MIEILCGDSLLTQCLALMTRTPGSYNDEGVWAWNPHGTDWIYQGGPDPMMQVDNGKGEMIPAKKSYNFNQWDELDSNTHTWATPVSVDPLSTDDWLWKVGGGIY